MAHASKSKAKGINASSFFDLKAELSKQESEFAKTKAAGNSTMLVGGVKRPDKKPTVWARPNKGVLARASRDIELEEIAKPTLDSARAILERKAKIYQKLKKGKSGGLSEAQFDALLVDFDADPVSSKYYESDSADEDESLTVPKPPDNNDPIVEYEDEFGRIRTAPRSEVPRHLMSNAEENNDDDDEDIVIRNPVNHFPTYQPSEERMAELAKAHSEENNPLNIHYDASKEVRAKGAGFYQFSGDEMTRAAQMEELKASREETLRTRQELGAEDVKPGEIEGMREGDPPGGTTEGTIKSKAMEKRKRDIEERRKILEAKRRKVDDATPSNVMSIADSQTSTPLERATLSEKDPMASLEAQSTTAGAKLKKNSEINSDPFATLEVQSTSSQKGKEKHKESVAANETDAFLSQLKEEFLGTRIQKRDS